MDDDISEFVNISCQVRGFSVDRKKIAAMAGVVCTSLGVERNELSVTFVGSRVIRRLNREFRGLDRPTDVLSFPQRTWRKPAAIKPARAKSRPRIEGSLKRKSAHEQENLPADVLGDLVISLPEAERNAKDIRQPFAREVCFLLVHGILHLCGYDHVQAAEEKKMRAAQRTLMRRLAGTGKTPLWRSSVKPPAERRAGRK